MVAQREPHGCRSQMAVVVADLQCGMVAPWGGMQSTLPWQANPGLRSPSLLVCFLLPVFRFLVRIASSASFYTV